MADKKPRKFKTVVTTMVIQSSTNYFLCIKFQMLLTLFIVIIISLK